jgi:hypothetical protein
MYCPEYKARHRSETVSLKKTCRHVSSRVVTCLLSMGPYDEDDKEFILLILMIFVRMPRFICKVLNSE